MNKKQSVLAKKIILLLFSSFCLISSAEAKIVTIGGESEVSSFLSDYYKEDVEPYTGQVLDSDFVYVNVGQINSNSIDNVVKVLIVDNKLTILDLTQIANEDERKEISKNLTGVGMFSPYIVSGQVDDEPVINAILSEEGEFLDQTEKERLISSFIFVLNRFGFKG